MLDINTETVCFLVAKLREFQVKEEVTIPEVPGSPTDDWARQVLADHLDDYCYQEIVATVKDLEPLQQATVVALMWLGRGDFEYEEWEEALQLAKNEWTPRTGDYLSATPMAADYIEEGLTLFGYSCQD